MRRRALLFSLGIGAGGVALSPLSLAAEPVQASPPVMQTLDLDEFLHGMLAVSLPIKMAIPAEYEYTALRNTSRFSAYWMRPDAARKAQRTGEMPHDTGWMSAEVSGSVVFDADTGTFIGLDLSSPTIAKGGFKVLDSEVVTVKDHPVVFVELLQLAANRPLYMMYVATLAGENVVLISYRAPRHNRVVGDAVWAELKQAVKAQ